MPSEIVTAAKIVSKSIDALTKEIHLLRKDLNRRDRLESCKEIKSEELETDEVDGMPKVQSPLVIYPGCAACSTGEGPPFPTLSDIPI